MQCTAQAVFLSELWSSDFGCPVCSDLRRKYWCDHVGQASSDTGQRGEASDENATRALKCQSFGMSLKWSEKLYHLEKLEGIKCRKGLKPKAQWPSARIHNQCRWPGTWSVVKNGNLKIELFLWSPKSLNCSASRINDTKTTVGPSDDMVWFVKVETAAWCSKDPHASIKASARRNQSRRNKDTGNKVTWTSSSAPNMLATGKNITAQSKQIPDWQLLRYFFWL